MGRRAAEGFPGRRLAPGGGPAAQRRAPRKERTVVPSPRQRGLSKPECSVRNSGLVSSVRLPAPDAPRERSVSPKQMRTGPGTRDPQPEGGRRGPAPRSSRSQSGCRPPSSSRSPPRLAPAVLNVSPPSPSIPFSFSPSFLGRPRRNSESSHRISACVLKSPVRLIFHLKLCILFYILNILVLSFLPLKILERTTKRAISLKQRRASIGEDVEKSGCEPGQPL